MWRSCVSLFLSLALCFLAAGLGSTATSSSLSTWYPQLDKPSWTPPNWVFGPVWTLLYALMGIAAWLVWRQKESSQRTVGLTLHGVQLALNLLWSVIFFGFQSPGVAAIEIVVLWAAIIATTKCYWSVSRAASWLMVPYIVWVTFAMALNISIWRLNL